MTDLTHLDDTGAAQMVNVSSKSATARRAVAQGNVRMSEAGLVALIAGDSKKGDVLAIAKIAGIMAAKRTSELIPLCHTIALSSVQVELTINAQNHTVEICATAEAVDRTGVEMEALTAVSVAALTVYDMLKAVDRSMVIGGIELLAKDGGQTGSYRRPVRVVGKRAAPTSPVPSDAPTRPSPISKRPTQASRRPQPTTSAPASTPASIKTRAERVASMASDDVRLRTYLRAHPVERAYMLGDLDPARAEHCQWWAIPGDAPGLLDAVALLYTGLRVPAVLTSGRTNDVHALIHAIQGQLPRTFYAQLRTHHVPAVTRSLRMSPPEERVRMGLTRATYTPSGGTDGVKPIGHRDTGALMALYTHYPDNFFDPAQLDTGLYCGIWEDETLVSVAGLHVLSEANDIATIGNIVTHTDYRGQGMASRCVKALLDRLFTRVGHVALNVSANNSPAIRCYEKFGFEEQHRFVEAWVHR
ncbi:MAG: cyclic pyranopterin phosphate synthase [Bradymonadia bacterium]|jgi:cyclic pyranopterin phosphate synthase